MARYPPIALVPDSAVVKPVNQALAFPLRVPVAHETAEADAGHTALMLVAARLRHVSANQWGLRKYMNVGLLTEMDQDVAYAAA